VEADVVAGKKHVARINLGDQRRDRPASLVEVYIIQAEVTAVIIGTLPITPIKTNGVRSRWRRQYADRTRHRTRHHITLIGDVKMEPIVICGGDEAAGITSIEGSRLIKREQIAARVIEHNLPPAKTIRIAERIRGGTLPKIAGISGPGSTGIVLINIIRGYIGGICTPFLEIIVSGMRVVARVTRLHPPAAVTGTTPRPVAGHRWNSSAAEVAVPGVGFKAWILYDIGSMRQTAGQRYGGEQGQHLEEQAANPISKKRSFSIAGCLSGLSSVHKREVFLLVVLSVREFYAARTIGLSRK
jgi:hypothetical protein